MRPLLFFSIFLLGLVSWSCSAGGPGADPTPSPTPTPTLTRVRLKIHWRSRSRNTVDVQSSALSVRITVGTGGPVLFLVNRDDRSESYTQTIESPNEILTGPVWFSVVYYSERDQKGEVIGLGGMVTVPCAGKRGSQLFLTLWYLRGLLAWGQLLTLVVMARWQ